MTMTKAVIIPSMKVMAMMMSKVVSGMNILFAPDRNQIGPFCLAKGMRDEQNTKWSNLNSAN